MTIHPPRRSGRLRSLVLGTLLATSTVAVAAQSSTSASSDEPRVGGELTVIGSEATSLDPTKGSANGMALIGSSIYDTLMIVPERGDLPQPNLAESLVESDDQMSWTLTLRPDVMFSDDTPLDAEAVKFNLDRGLEAGTTTAALLSSIESVEVVDDLTVLIHMKAPFADLPYVFSYDGSGTAGYIASPAALEQYGDDYSAHAAGAGPFMVTHWAPGEPTELVRNPNYWNAANQDVYLDKVTIRAIGDPQSAYQAIQAGDADLLGTPSTTLMRTAMNDSQVQFVEGVDGSQDSIILNMATGPFTDLRLRQALSMAIDREELAALATEGFGTPATSLFPDGSPFDNDNSVPTFDLDGAKALIEEYEAETGEDATIRFTCSNARTQGDVIASQLEAAGFTVEYESLEPSVWVSTFFEKKYDAICWTMAGFLTPGLLPYRFLYSTGDLNTGGYNSPEFDRLADEARATSDPDAQRDLWTQADAVLTQDLPWVWTVTSPTAFIATQRVHSIDLDQPSRMRYYVPTFANVWVED